MLAWPPGVFAESPDRAETTRRRRLGSAFRGGRNSAVLFEAAAYGIFAQSIGPARQERSSLPCFGVTACITRKNCRFKGFLSRMNKTFLFSG